MIFDRTVAETDEDAAELRRLKEEHLSTEKCLEICAQLSEHIDQIKVPSKLQNCHPGSVGALPEKVVNESLQECHQSLAHASSELETYMRDTIQRLVAKSKTAMTSKEEVADLARIWDELETTLKRKVMFSAAESRLHENISKIENYGKGDARQIMVATDDKTLHGKNHGEGWRSFQVGGRMSEAALQDVVRNMCSLRDRRPDDDGPSPPGETPTRIVDDVAERASVAKFRDQYGRGFQLSPTADLQSNDAVAVISAERNTIC